MSNKATSTLEQLELQTKVNASLEAYCAERGLPPRAPFDLLVSYAWARARLGGASSEEIKRHLLEAADRCEAAYQRASALPHAELPFNGRQS